MMKKTLLKNILPGLLLLGLVLLAGSQPGLAAVPVQAAVPAADLPGPGFHLVEQQAGGLILEYRAPDLRWETSSVAGKACRTPYLENAGFTDQPGAPRLPLAGQLLALPPGAQPQFEILAQQTEDLPAGLPLCPVVPPVVDPDLIPDLQPQALEPFWDTASYAASQIYPEALVQLGELASIRSQQVLPVYLAPLRYQPASGELLFTSYLRLRLDFGAAQTNSTAPLSQVAEPYFDTFFQSVLLNSTQGQNWRTAPQALNQVTSISSVASGMAYKMLIGESGLYQLTYAELEALGLPVTTLDPRTLAVYHQDQAVDILVTGEANAKFEPGELILFYAQALENRYTDTNVYWLTWGQQPGARMSAQAVPPAGGDMPTQFNVSTHLEEDHYYYGSYPSGPDKDFWYWDRLFASNAVPVTRDYVVDLAHLATDPVSATLRGLVFGYYGVQESWIQVSINGNPLLDTVWPNQTEYSFEVDFPQAYLQEGSNTITLRAPLGGNVTANWLLLNWLELDYYDTFVAENGRLDFSNESAGDWLYQISGFDDTALDLLDVTDPDQPRWLTGWQAVPTEAGYTLSFQHAISEQHQYQASAQSVRLSPQAIFLDQPSDLHSLDNAADYIVISHADFLTEVQPLVDQRQAQGLRTLLVDVQDVYDEFSGGVFGPDAIRDFLHYAYLNYQSPAPAFVLLVGDGHYDYKDIFETGEKNFIPPYMGDFDPWLRDTAADNRFVAFIGADVLPDMAIGRFPVKTPAEAALMVANVLAYEAAGPQTWSDDLLFVADNADQAGNFAAFSDAIANNHLPSPYLAERVYYGVNYLNTADTKAAILEAINDGVLMVSYVGHASRTDWAGEKFFGINDLAAFDNHGNLPFMVPMTCLEGLFMLPSSATFDLSSLAERLVRMEDKGAIASWSPSGLGVATGHDLLERGLFEAIFADDIREIGLSTTAAKYFLYAGSPGYRDLIDTYNLLGDPALRLNTLPAELELSQTVQTAELPGLGTVITYTLSYTNSGPASAHHVVIEDALPELLQDVDFSTSGAAAQLRYESRLVWDVEDLAAGEGGTITISGWLPAAYQCLVVNPASITTSAYELDLANNRSQVLAGDYCNFVPIVNR